MSEYSDLIKAAQDQVMAQNAMEDEYSTLQRRIAEEDLRRARSDIYNEAAGAVELNALNRLREQGNVGDLELQARERVQKLIDNGIEDPNQLYRMIKEDPILSKKYFTDRDTLDVIHQIQDAVVSARNPYNALEGKEVVSDGGFLSNFYHSAKSTLAETAGGLLYDTQKNYQVSKLSNLPLKDLRAIESKMNTQRELQSKLKVAQERLFSNDPQTRSNALTDITYLQDAIKGLNLTEQEQNILNTYGKQYFDTKNEIADLTYKKEHLFGANEITQDQANRIVNNTMRDNLYKYSGIEPTFMDDFIHGMKDSFSNPGEELGMIFGFFAPLAIGGTPGLLLKGASVLSEASSVSSQLMEEYINKHGELPDEKMLSAGIHGLLTAAIDQYLTHGLGVGKKYARGMLRGVGLTEADRLAEEAARKSAKALKGLTKGIPVNQQAFAATQVITRNTEAAWKNIEDVLKKSANSKALEDVAESVADKSLLGKAASVVSLPKNIRRAQALNRFAHERFGTGVQDIAKASAGLALENAGSTLVRQNYDDTWDMGEVAKAAGQGIATGGMFHAAASPVGVGVRKATTIAKEAFNKTNGLDDDSTFNKFVGNIEKNADTGDFSRTELNSAIEAYTKTHKGFQEKVDKLKTENKNIKDNYDKKGLVFDSEGKAKVDVANMPTGVTEKQLKALAKNYNSNREVINNLENKVKERLEGLDKLKKRVDEKFLKNPKTTEEERTDIINDIILEGTDVDATKQVMETQHVDEDTAKNMVKEYRDRANTKLSEASKKFNTNEQEILKSLKGMVSITDLYDIRNVDGFKEALESGDAKQVEEVIKNSGLSDKRKEHLKGVLNQNMLDNMGRNYNTITDKVDDVSKLDRTTRNAIKKELVKDSPKELKDITTEDEAKNFIFNEVLSNKNKLENAAAMDVAIDKLMKESSIPDALKKNLEDKEYKGKYIKELQNAAKKHNDYNNKLKKYKAKIYTTKEAAEKALQAYHKNASKAYYVEKITNPEGKDEFFIKNNIADTRDKISTLKKDIATNSGMKREEFFNKIDEIINTFNTGLSTDNQEDFSKWKDKAKKAYDKLGDEKDTSKVNKVKDDILSELKELTVDRLSENVHQMDVAALSKGNAKIHGYTSADKKEKKIQEKQLQIALKEKEETEEALRAVDELSKDTNPVTMSRYIKNATTTIYRELHGRTGFADAMRADFTGDISGLSRETLPLTRKDVLTIHSFLNSLSSVRNTAQYQSDINAARHLINIINYFGVAQDAEVNSTLLLMPTEGTSLYENQQENQTAYAAIVNLSNHIPEAESTVFNYNELPEGKVDISDGIEKLSEEIKLDQFIEDREDLIAYIATDTSTRVINLLRELNRVRIPTKDGKVYSGLAYLASIYNPSLLNNSGVLAEEVITRNTNEWASLFVHALTDVNPTLRIMLGIEPGKTGEVDFTRLGNKDYGAESVINGESLNATTHTAIPWNDIEAALGISGTAHDTISEKINALREGIGSETFREVVYRGMALNSHISPEVMAEIYRNSRITYGVPTTVLNSRTVTGDIRTYLFTTLGVTPDYTTTDGARRYVKSLYQRIRQEYINSHADNFADFFNSSIAATGHAISGTLYNRVNSNFVNLCKTLIRDHIRDELEDYLRRNPTLNYRTDVTYKGYVTALDYVSVLPESMSKYSSHTIINTGDATKAKLGEFLEVLKQYVADPTHSRVTINDILREPNNIGAMKDIIGRIKTNATSDSLSEDQIKTLSDAFNGSIANTDIASLQGLSEANQNLLARKLALYINNHGILNTTAANTTTSNVPTGIAHRSGLRDSRLYNYIRNSEYFKYVVYQSLLRTVPGALSEELLSQLDEHRNTNATQILELAKDLIKVGKHFTECKNDADKLFATTLGTRVMYTKEMLRALALVGMSSLATARTGQSPEWLNTQIAANRLTQVAANTMLANNLMDYATFVESLGNSTSGLIPIRFTGEAPAGLDNRVKLGLGIRALNMLEEANIIQKQYLNTVTGKLTTEQPKDLTNIVRVLQITKDGTSLADKIETADKFTDPDGSPNSVIKTLLGEPRDSNTFVDNSTDGRANAYQQEQNRRSRKWTEDGRLPEADRSTYEETIGDNTYRIVVDQNTDTGFVECISTPSGDPNDALVFNGSNRYYLVKKQVRKPGGEYIKPVAMVEEAFKSSIGYKIDTVKWNHINGIIQAIIARYSGDEKDAYQSLTADEFAMFGMDDPNKVQSQVRQFVFAKNRAIWRQVLQFRNDINSNNITNNSVLYYNVLNTHNNRFYVDSIHLNYREFKLFRELFTPNDPQHDPKKYNLTEKQVKQNKDILYAFVLHNLGAPVDKMDMAHINQLGEQLYAAINGNLNFENAVNEFDDAFKRADLAGLKQARDKINSFFKGIDISYEKVPGPIKKTFKIDGYNLFTTDVLSRLPDLLASIHNGTEIDKFHYLIEVDGLNNGTSIHYAQSGLFGDNTPLTIDKLTSVGVFQGVDINGNGGVVFQDYLQAAYEGRLDAYLQSAAIAKDKSKAQQYRELLLQSAKDNPRLQDCIIVLGRSLGMEVTKYNEVLDQLTDRDIIKYVSMPNSYGAGAEALTNYIYDNILENCSKFIASLLNDTSKDTAAKYNRVVDLFESLQNLSRKYGDPKADLILMDKDGNTIALKDALAKANMNPALQIEFMNEYLPEIRTNVGLSSVFKEGIVQHILDGAAHVTVEANRKKVLYSEAVENLMELYVASVQDTLNNSERIKDKKVNELTNADIDFITNQVTSSFNIGEDEQSLSVFKQAIMPAIALASYRNKIQGFTSTGVFDVVSTKDLLSRDMNVTGFNPESVHTIDKDIISRAGAEMREILGTFVGIHDAAIVDVNQAVQVGKKLNEKYLESTIHSYQLPLDIAKEIECAVRRFNGSNYLNPAMLAKCEKSIRNLRNFATEQATAKIRFLQTAIQNYKAYKADPKNNAQTIIKQYAFASDGFVVTEAVATKYIDEIIKRFRDTNMSPITAEQFLNFVGNTRGTTTELYKELKKLFELVGKTYEFSSISSMITNRASARDTDIRDSKVATDANLLKEFRVAVKDFNKVNSNAGPNIFQDFVDNALGLDAGVDASSKAADRAVGIISSKPGTNNSKTFTSAMRNIFDESINAGLFVDDTGDPVKGNNNFLDNFVLSNAYKLSGLYNLDGMGIVNAIIALTNSSGVSNLSLNRLNEAMGDIDTTITKLTTYDKNANTVVVDFDDVPLQDLLDKFTREARQINASDSSITINHAYASLIRSFANDYIDVIESKCKRFGDKPVQVVFKCDSSIDRIVLSVLNERLNNNTFRDNNTNICIVPNVSNVESTMVNRNNHYFAALACEVADGTNLKQRDKAEVATVLNQSNNKDLTHRNFMYQNQFNATGLIGKTSPNGEFSYNFSTKSNIPSKSKSVGLDPVGIGIADYYGTIQRTMLDGNITSDALNSFDSYSPDGFNDYQHNVKTYNEISEADLNNSIRNTSNIVTDPNDFDNFYVHKDLDTEGIVDLGNEHNLVFGLDSAGNLVESKVARSIIESAPEFKEALEAARNIYNNNTKFLQENTHIDRDSMYPPIHRTVYINGLKLNLHFFVNEDFKINLSDAAKVIQPDTDSAYKGQYMLNPKAPEELRRLFSEEVIRNAGKNNPSHPMNEFFGEVYKQILATPESVRRDTYINIPKNLRSTSKDLDTLSDKAKAINTLSMNEILTRDATTHIFGSKTNNYAYNTSTMPYVYDFGTVKGGDVAMGTISTSIRDSIANGRNRVMDTLKGLIHGYTVDKDHNVLSRFQRAVFTDTNCNDLQDTFDDLATFDRSNMVSSKDTELCREVFNELRSLNTNIRVAFKEDAIKRNGFAAVLDKDPDNSFKPTGYVYLETASNGSNVTTFTHELVHVPLHYLSKDPRSNHMAVEMYNFIADNLRMSDFDCNDDQAREIYDYLFKDKNTTEPYIECLDMLLTERAFINAVNKMNSRLNFKKEFNDRAKGILNRFLDKIDKNAVNPSSDFHNVAMQILKNSIDIANTYNQKAEKPDLGYLSNADSVVAKLNRGFQEAFGKLTNKLKPFTSRIANANLRAMGAMAQYNMVSPQESNDQIEELMPELINFVSNTANVKGSVADQFKQSFEGVSKNNYDYVKLRYKAKEEVDKQREVASTAVNAVVDKLTSKMPTKILANMSPAVLKTDVSCLLNDRLANDAKSKYNTKQYLKRTLEEPEYRQNQIENLERQLKKTGNGNFFINAAKGLANKLVYGVNSSGIGYNNAYEIANLCGTSNATMSSTLESTIDKYVTLRAMQLYSNEYTNHVYNYLASDINNFYELSVMHNTIKDMEKNSVYGDSLQKYHVPKGELHGASRENSFALVPESDVKAYEWLGYKKLKKAKLDTFYNRLTTEPYYVMEGRNLPNVPYVSGIPVLSDIFNGRNHSGININGNRLGNSHISERYNNSEFTNVSNYMNTLVKRLNDPRYKVPTGKETKKAMDGVITPTYGYGNRLTGADFVLNDRLKNKILGLDHKYTTALGDHYGSIIERTKAPEWNTKAAEALDEIYLARRDSSKFTWLTSTNEDANLVEIYNLLPYEIKDYFRNKYGDNGVPVETRYLTGITGYKEASANKIDTKYYKKKDELKDEFETKEQLNAYVKFRDSTMGYLNHLFHSGPMAKLENTARWLTRIGKLNVVVRSCTVSLNNIASNCVTLGVLGLNPSKVCQYQTEGLNELLKYKELKKEKAAIEAKAVLGRLSDVDRAKIRNIDSALNNSLIGYMADKGGLPTVAEDISQPDRLLKDSIDRYIPRQLQGLFHKATGDEKSWLLQTLTDLSSFGDITARYAQLKYLTEDQNLDKDEAYRQCMQTFIDYSNPLPKGIQYFDSIGALPFTKFLLGNQTNVLNSITKNPTGALSWIAANSYMNVSDIYGSILGFDSITDRWKLPGFGLFYDSLASLPIMKGTKAALDIL